VQTFCDLETICTNEGVHGQNGFPVVPGNWKVFESQVLNFVGRVDQRQFKINRLATVE